MADPAFSSLPPAPSGEGGMPGFAEEGEEEHNLEMQMHLASIGGAGEGAGGAEEYFDYYDDVGPTGGEEEQQGGPFSNNNNNCSSSNDEEEEEEDVIPRGIG